MDRFAYKAAVSRVSGVTLTVGNEEINIVTHSDTTWKKSRIPASTCRQLLRKTSFLPGVESVESALRVSQRNMFVFVNGVEIYINSHHWWQRRPPAQ